MKIDLHCHSYYSIDGISSPEKLIRTALKKGLDGIALTDHDTTKGWEEAKKAAQKLGVILILGEEVKTRRNGKVIGDILGVFLKKEIKSREPFKVIKEIKMQDGIAILAHPFHYRERFKDDLEKYKNLIDGIEAFNARLPFSSADKKALDFALKNNLPIVAGSDAHHHREIGNAYTIVENVRDLRDFKEAILTKKTKIRGKKSSIFTLVIPFLARIKHF